MIYMQIAADVGRPFIKYWLDQMIKCLLKTLGTTGKKSSLGTWFPGLAFNTWPLHNAQTLGQRDRAGLGAPIHMVEMADFTCLHQHDI